MSATVIVIDPFHPKLGVLATFFAHRVASYADEYQPQVAGVELASHVMQRLWGRDPRLLALGIVGADGVSLVGHALATAEQMGSRSWVNVSQLRADEGVGTARLDAVKACIQWAAALGTTQVLLDTNRDGKEFQKLGFVRYRTGHRFALQAPAAAPAPASVPDEVPAP